MQIDGQGIEGLAAKRGVYFPDDALMPVRLSAASPGISAHHWLGRPGFAGAARSCIQECMSGSVAHFRLASGKRCARRMAVEPDFLLLREEPFSASTRLSRERMQGLLLDLWRPGLFPGHPQRRRALFRSC